MTPERARYILANKLLGGALRYSFSGPGYRGAPHGHEHTDGITRDEDAAVRAVWFAMPPSACYFSALCEIANGRA